MSEPIKDIEVFEEELLAIKNELSSSDGQDYKDYNLNNNVQCTVTTVKNFLNSFIKELNCRMKSYIENISEQTSFN